jgi:hypothetical protein
MTAISTAQVNFLNRLNQQLLEKGQPVIDIGSLATTADASKAINDAKKVLGITDMASRSQKDQIVALGGAIWASMDYTTASKLTKVLVALKSVKDSVRFGAAAEVQLAVMKELADAVDTAFAYHPKDKTQ